MKELSNNAVSWVVLVAGSVSYVALLVISNEKSIGPLLVTAVIVVVLLFRNELSPKRRRRRRMEAGLCPLCGYDLQHDIPGGCSECGWERPV